MFQHNKDITQFTTFGIPVKAKLFAEYTSLKELIKISRTEEFLNNDVLHIGGGSNLLFMQDFDGLVLHSQMKGITRYEKNDDTIYAISAAGEKWTDFVDWCISEGLAGVENLAGIPGEVGASAVQNIGAYGAEAKDVIYTVECFDTTTRQTVKFYNEKWLYEELKECSDDEKAIQIKNKIENLRQQKRLCRFGYRDSFFKHEGKGLFYVLRVSFRLKKSKFAENLNYAPIKKYAEGLGRIPTTRELADEVTRIRNQKLPDPEVIGNAGSFFTNPVVNRYFYEEQMLGLDPDIPHYDVDEHTVKVPAGWLIEHAGLKGYRIGGAEIYPKQCLVIANADNATAYDVKQLAKHVVMTVLEKYAVVLRPEVNLIDNRIEVTVLGSGTSKGVPEVACACRVCRSESHFDKRLRASVLVKTHGMDILIDASPDFRQQAIEHKIFHLDATLITHSHYDHVGGLDDLRPFCAFGDVPLYMRKDVNDDLHRRLDYCFREHPYPGVPVFDVHEIKNEPFYINGLKIIPISVMHGKLPIVGYRIGNFAYITDAKTIPEEEIEKLYGLKVLIVNALRQREHFAHFCVEEALDLIRRVKPDEAYLTHFNHEIGLHTEVEAMLPPHVHPCYDGLTLTISN
ncbi:MAG: FAD-binding protein [Bacteroides sp.]|nr:FAD-binding protein [Bacteroides sp.]